MISKDKLVFDSAELASSDDVGAYLRSSDGTLLTHTDVGGKKALDVNVANTIDVSVDHTTDSVKVGDGTDFLAINADGSINITDNGGSLTVDATDFDIRNLNHAQDNVAIAQGGNTMVVNADGSINVNADISVVNGSDKAEDSAHASGDIGTYVLSVRQDTLAISTSASGDYQSFKSDALGRMYMNDAAQTALFAPVSVATSATDLVASDLANRRKILIQNVSNRTIYVGSSSVTASNGLRITAGSSIELNVGPQVDLYAIAVGGSADVRVLELA